MCRSATVSSLCAVQHSPSASGRIPVLRHALTNPLERVCAIKHHDTVVQILANVIVALRDALSRFVVGSVQRKRSAPTLMMFPRKNSDVSSLSALSEVDLSNVSQS